MRLLTLSVLMSISSLLFSQPANFYCSMGGGMPTLQGGWAAYCSLTFEKKLNVVTLSAFHGSESGKKIPGFFSSQRYNDKFSEFALMYGRAYMPWEWFRMAGSIGGSKYYYVNKDIGPRSSGFFSMPTITSKYYEGWGLSLKGSILFVCGEEFGLGIDLIGNMNSDNTLGAALLTLSFGSVRRY